MKINRLNNRHPARWIVAIALLLCSFARSDSHAADPKHDPTDMYQVKQMRGWEVRVHEELLEDSAKAGRVLDLLEHRLAEIKRRVSTAVVEKLQTVTIWVELEHATHPIIHYHPSRGWLEANGFLPEKARGVEIGSAKRFLSIRQDQPFVMLHELAHAYHHQFLEDGYANTPIREAYEEAVESGQYDQVLHISGRQTRHYGLTSPMEYFAEGVEAYFGTNDFYPFVRAELNEHDPRLYQLIEEKWKVGTRRSEINSQ